MDIEVYRTGATLHFSDVWLKNNEDFETEMQFGMSDLMFSTACALGDRGARGGAICAAQGALIQTFGVAGALWAALVSRALMESLRAGRARGDARRGAFASRGDAAKWTAPKTEIRYVIL